MDIKTCGIKDEAALDAVLARGATHVGFIFFPRSPRHIDPEEAARLATHIGERARTVAVTVDADDSTLDAIIETVEPNMLQLHGSETPERVAEVRARYGRAIVKAFSVRETADLERTSAYDGPLLFDAKPPKGADLPGGNGVGFDWAVLEGFDRPFWLSGGLHEGNVAEAVRRVRPAGLDLSSGLESAPGMKDVARIHRFFDALDAALQETA